MTEVDFYILPENTLAARDHFACRLAEKALHTGRHVVIRVSDQPHADSLSEYLWSFKPEAFVPHCIASANDQATKTAEKIIIDWQGHTDAYHDVIINLQHAIPEEFSRFNKLSEIVVQEKELLAITRESFQYYRNRGYPLKSHKM
jgi:DNA polymerase III subunit chi